MAVVLVVPLVVVACASGADRGPTASPLPPTSASEAREAAVATTTQPARAIEPGPPAGALRGHEVCALLLPEDVEPLGLDGAGSPGAAACTWTDPTDERSLVLATSTLGRPPVPSAQDYQVQLGREPAGWLDVGDAGLLLTTSSSETLLVIFAADLRLDFVVPAARELAIDVARVAIGRLGPRRPVAEPAEPAEAAEPAAPQPDGSATP
jgi:hypothetical protein